MTRPAIEPRSPGPLANTLPTRPMSTLIDLYEFPHIFYVKNNPHLLSLDTDWIFNIYIYIGLAVRVFANGPGDMGSIPGRCHTKD